MASALGTFALGLGGVLVGAGLVTFLHRDAARAAPPVAHRDEVPAAGASAADVMMQTLRAQAMAPPSVVGVADAGVAAAPPTLDPEALRKAEADQRADKLAMHESEARDARWAATMEKNLQADLAQLGGKDKFETVSVECRSTSCLAELEYPSYAEASASRVNLVTHRYATPCAREAFTPRPDDPSAPFRAQLLIQCDEPSE